MAKLKGLGRGLDALLAGGEDEALAPTNEALRNLEIDRLQPGKYQPRTKMDQDSLAQLSDSIKTQGVVQPILVRQLNEEKYEIIAGERRWRAARMAGLTEIPALVREIPDEAALAISLIENIQRENLNPLEEAHGVQRLIDEFGMTHQAAAEAVGRSRSAVSNLLRLLNLAPPVQDMLMENRIDMGHARALLSLDAGKQTEAAHMIAERGLSVREAEKLAQKVLSPEKHVKAPKDHDVERLEEEISEKLGAKVSIKTRSQGKGKLVIEYDSLDQLDVIINSFLAHKTK
jgi:ParB family chromosome partitioning protein